MQTLTGESEISQERRHLTVMFCDVVGSTALSSRQDIEAYFSILRAYYDACEPVVKRHEGLVAQHQGDGIFVWFGYPEPKDDDAIRAVRAGLDLLVVLRRLSADMESLGGEALTVRMAAHAGEVLVAAVDGEKMPIAFGHTPNVADKLQQAARPGSFVISDAVRRLTRDTFELTPLDPSRLGDGSTVPVFEVVAERRPVSREHVWRTPLIGREAEQHQLADARAASANGGSVAILLVGERGIGKSRLASAIAGDPTPARSTVLECACHPLDAGTAYRPFRSLLSQAAGIEPDDPPIVSSALLQQHLIDELGMDAAAAAILAQIMSFGPELAGPATDLDPARLGQITNDLLIDWIGRVSAAAPTLMLIDDVPDADPSSLAVLGQVTTALPPRLLLLFTARSDSTLPAFLRNDAVETVELKQLADNAADQLVRAIESTIAIDPARRVQVLQLGEGVPLYLEELARAAQETSDTGRVPITLTERLQARLTAPTIDREIVGVLAAAGQDVEESLLAAVLGVSVDEMRTRLQGLLSADLVVHAGATASSLRFRHGLIGEAAYARLLNAQRAELHDRLATAMQQYRQDGRTIDWSVVGQHLRRAGRDLDAFEAILAGAEQARNAGAITEALGGYQDALQVVNDVADPTVRDILEVRCRLQRGITAISARGFGADEAVEDFGRCAELCFSMGPRPEHLTALSGVYAYYLLQGDLHRARQIVEDLRTWVETGHADHQPENDLGFGVLSFYEGNYRDAVTQLSAATQRSGELVTERTAEQTWLLPFDPVVSALAQLSASLWLTGRPRAGHDAADRAVARAATLPFPEGPFSMAYAKSYQAWIYALGGHHDAAARISREVRDIGAHHGFAFWESTGEIHLALSEYRINGRSDAWDTVSLHATIWDLLRARVFLPYVLTAAAQMRGDMERPDEAIAGFDAAGTLVEETGVRFFEAERLRLLARVLPPERRADADELRLRAWELAREQGAVVFELRAALDLARTDGSTAIARVEAALRGFPPGAGYPEINEARALLANTAAPA